MGVSYRNGVAVGEIVYYSPALLIAIYLMVRHGWRSASGWLFLAAFSIARLLGAAMQLATTRDPDNLNLYIGYATLANIGLSPLLLASLCLLSRVLFSIHKSYTTLLHPMVIRFMYTVTVVALILTIVGATSLPDSAFLDSSAKYSEPPTLIAGTILFFLYYGAIFLFTMYLWIHSSHAEPGELRLLIAVTVSLPILAVRIVYTGVSVLGNDKKFSSLSGSVTIFLWMALIMEALVVAMYEGTGLTLRRMSKEEQRQMQQARNINILRQHETATTSNDSGEHNVSKYAMLKSLGKKTLIGRLIVLVKSES